MCQEPAKRRSAIPFRAARRPRANTQGSPLRFLIHVTFYNMRGYGKAASVTLTGAAFDTA